MQEGWLAYITGDQVQITEIGQAALAICDTGPAVLTPLFPASAPQPSEAELSASPAARHPTPGSAGA